MDLERAQSMIMALPFMSKTIVDDTLYEKVLSFLTLVLATHDADAISNLNRSCQIFKQIQQTCLIEHDQDYRVTTLCIRFMGQLVHYGQDRIFSELQHDYPELLIMVTDGIKSSEAALRCACIEACRLFLTCSKGHAWLLHNQKAALLITYAILDQSSYVVSQACQLFSTVLKLSTHDLLDIMDPSPLIQSILVQPGGDQKQLLSALDFCWELVCTKENALQYIQSKKLLHSMILLLCLSDRMIRSRVLEILSCLFTWDKEPLLTLNLTSAPSNVDQAYITLSSMAMDMIRQASRLDELTTALSLLDATFTLFKRRSTSATCSTAEPYDVLYKLFRICVYKDDNDLSNIKQLVKSNRIKNSVLQQVIRAIDTLVETDPQIIHEKRYIRVFDVLKHDTAYADPRILKATLILLTNTLYNLDGHQQLQHDILTQSMHALVNILTNDETVLDCKSLSIVLESFNTLLSHYQIGTLVTESGKALAESLSLKFLDTEWDMRDAVIHFVGLLFKEPTVTTKVQFALTYDLPLEVFQRIHDSEPYVRASAVEVLQMMMKCKEGWDYIQQHKVSRDLAGKLPSLLYDTEAFVRRATLDAIICLVENRSCQGMEFQVNDSLNQTSLNPQIIRKLVHDEDVDVCTRACKLLKHLWLLYKHEKRQKKKHRDTNQGIVFFFVHINADKLLADSAVDTNRIVRIEAVRVIENILSEYGTTTAEPGKRHYHDQDDFETRFLDTLRNVNITQQKQTLDPEHLYQEAFDINADMMTSSIIPKNPDDDMNMLDCY